MTVETAIETGIAPSGRHHLTHPTIRAFRAFRPAIHPAPAGWPPGKPARARVAAGGGAPALRAASPIPTA
ncbi:hypothetical protein PSAC2689_80288 [Paraburkholderia sacchari]